MLMVFLNGYGCAGRSSPTVVASFLTRFTGFEVSVDEDVAAAKDRMTLPLSFANPRPPTETLERLGLEAKTQPARRSSPWAFSFRKQAAIQQRTTFNVSFTITGNNKKTPRSVLADLEPFRPVLLPPTSGATDDARRSEIWRASARLGAMTCFTIPILVLVWSDLDQSTLRRRRWAELVLSTIVQVLAWPLFRTSLRVAWYLDSADLGLLATISTSLAWLFSVIAFSFEVAGKAFAEPFFETSALLITLIHVGRGIQMATRLVVGSVIEGLNDLQPADVTLVQKSAEGAEELQELDSR
jgi:cation transport ATPase